MRPAKSLIPALLLVGAVGCDPGEPTPAEPTPESVALGLFELAAEDDPGPARVATAFGEVDDERLYAALLDAVRAMRAAEMPEIVDTYTLDEGTRTGFDLEASGGGGFARYSVLLDTTTPPGRIVWFNGPGVEWPERRRGGPGVSTSAPPGPGEGG